MDNLFNFQLHTEKPLSFAFRQLHIQDFHSACKYVQQLSYGRNSDGNMYEGVLLELKGTCSTKHALLAALAQENDYFDINLCIGIYKMNAENTGGISGILKPYDLSFIPEAHCYLKYNDSIYDFTRSVSSETSFENDLLLEIHIRPDHIGDHKKKLHQDFIRNWIIADDIPYSFDTIWTLREACISALSK